MGDGLGVGVLFSLGLGGSLGLGAPSWLMETVGVPGDIAGGGAPPSDSFRLNFWWKSCSSTVLCSWILKFVELKKKILW